MQLHLFRTKKILEKYKEFKKSLPNEYCPLCNKENLIPSRKIIKKYQHWTLIENDFPYDKLTKEHKLLISKRHIGNETDLTVSEVAELLKIKTNLLQRHDYDLLENNTRMKSIPGHFHIHFVIWK